MEMQNHACAKRDIRIQRATKIVNTVFFIPTRRMGWLSHIVFYLWLVQLQLYIYIYIYVCVCVYKIYVRGGGGELTALIKSDSFRGECFVCWLLINRPLFSSTNPVLYYSTLCNAACLKISLRTLFEYVCLPCSRTRMLLKIYRKSYMDACKKCYVRVHIKRYILTWRR